MNKPLDRRDVLRLGLGASLALGLGSGVTCGVRASGASVPTNAARKRSLRLAHMTDSHLQPELAANDGVAACLRHIHTRPDAPELILTGGDLVMDTYSQNRERTAKLWRLWLDVMKGNCTIPVEHCLGNHDIWGWNKAKSGTTGDEAEWGKKWACDVLGLAKPYRSFDRAGWHFVVLDSVFPDGDGYVGKLDDAQFAWLESDLQAVGPGVPVLVVSHIPIVAACPLVRDSNQVGNDRRIPGADMMSDGIKLHRLFAASGKVKLCLSGHIHMLDDVRLDGVRYICDGAVSGAWWKGRGDRCQEGYGLIDLFDDGTADHEYVTYGWKARE